MDSNFRPFIPMKHQLIKEDTWCYEDFEKAYEHFKVNPRDLDNTAMLLSVLQHYVFTCTYKLWNSSTEYYNNIGRNMDRFYKNKQQTALLVVEIAKSLSFEPALIQQQLSIMGQNYFMAGDINNALFCYQKLLICLNIKVKENSFLEYDYNIDILTAIAHNIILLNIILGDYESAQMYLESYKEAFILENQWINTPHILSEMTLPDMQIEFVNHLIESPFRTFFCDLSLTIYPLNDMKVSFFCLNGKYPIGFTRALEYHQKTIFDSCDSTGLRDVGEYSDWYILASHQIDEYLANLSVDDNIPSEADNSHQETCSNQENSNSREANNTAKTADELLDELNNLIGLDEIKKDVISMINMLKVRKIREAKGLPSIPMSNHLVFIGNPGTGKTSVARILAKLYKEIGVLRSGHLIEVDRSQLVAGYVGQTAIKTQEKIKESLGGVLFIDEAYTLAKDGNDFGQEAIDTLLKAMEDHRDDFIVIVAGYKENMQKFINSNPGLKSRFSKYFEFSDYNSEELYEIFYKMIDKYGYSVDKTADSLIKEYFVSLTENKEQNFANAREVRNFFERIVTNQANRVVSMSLEDDELLRITVEDVM